MAAGGVVVVVRREDEGRMSRWVLCRYCGLRIELVQGHPLDVGPVWVHTVSRASHCKLFATPHEEQP